MAHDSPHAAGRPGGMAIAETAGLTNYVTYLSVGTAAILLVLKGAAWFFTGSIAMLASLADSGLDVLASLATFAAVRYAVAPPDRQHRYGHGKAEAFASLIQGGLVFASAALIGQEAISHILKPKPLAYEGWALGAMAVSLVMTVALVWIQTRVLSRASSVAVSGDRAHYIADVASNVVALVGIAAAALLHEPWIDAVAGLVVTAWLVWGAVTVFRQASVELMDAELPDEARADIRARAGDDPRVRGVHQLRTRASGPYIHIQMHIDLAPDISLEAAHEVVVAAEKRVLEVFPAADIIIHPDPDGRAEPHGGAFGEPEYAGHGPVGD